MGGGGFLNGLLVAYLQVFPYPLVQAAVQRLNAARRRGGALEQLSAADEVIAAATTAAVEGASLGQIAKGLGFHKQKANVVPLASRSLAEPFEALRDASNPCP